VVWPTFPETIQVKLVLFNGKPFALAEEVFYMLDALSVVQETVLKLWKRNPDHINMLKYYIPIAVV